MKVFYSDSHRRHAPPFEVVDGGQRAPYWESPARMDSALAALRQTSWAQILEPAEFGLAPVQAVHSEAYLAFLESAWNDWQKSFPSASPPTADSGFLPATFAVRGSSHVPASILGRAGYHMMDLSAVIVSGTYEAALSAANCALSAAKAIRNREGVDACAFALCRPPGHHSGPDYAAGYCYINNAAIAAQWLSNDGRVAVVDVDYHAGNGTQDIFYRRNDVLTVSLHADPAVEYPYFSGYADETGAEDGAGFHQNFPLPVGTGDEQYLATLDRAIHLVHAFEPRHLIVSVGMDVYEHDPLGQFKISTGGIRAIGERISRLRIPTALIMEGGYNTAELGANVVAFVAPFAS